MPDLDPDAEQRLADMDDAEFAALVARVRPPSSVAQLRDIAAKHIGNGDRLEAFLNVANPKAFARSNGDVDAEKVQRALQSMFDISPAQPAHENFGQYTEQPTMPGPGDRGRAEARKRFGNNGAPSSSGRGSAGAAEAARRFGKRHN